MNKSEPSVAYLSMKPNWARVHEFVHESRIWLMSVERGCRMYLTAKFKLDVVWFDQITDFSSSLFSLSKFQLAERTESRENFSQIKIHKSKSITAISASSWLN